MLWFNKILWFRFIEDSYYINRNFCRWGKEANKKWRCNSYSKNKNFVGYFEVSSKTGRNVINAFEFLANCIYQINNNNKNLKDLEFTTLLY